VLLFLQSGLIVLVYAAPYLVLFGLIALAALKIRARIKKGRKAVPAAGQENDEVK